MTESTIVSPQESLRHTLKRLAVLVAAACKATASSASLRRGTPADVVRSASFHRVLASTEMQEVSVDRLLGWAALVQCMAIGGDHSAPLSDGAMLARAGLSESRFSRLLAAGGSTVHDQCLLAARFLHARGHPCRWDDLGALLILDEGSSSHAERARLRLARDYYRTLGD